MKKWIALPLILGLTFACNLPMTTPEQTRPEPAPLVDESAQPAVDSVSPPPLATYSPQPILNTSAHSAYRAAKTRPKPSPMAATR